MDSTTVSINSNLFFKVLDFDDFEGKSKMCHSQSSSVQLNAPGITFFFHTHMQVVNI